MAQGAIDNAVRYAGAEQITITLDYSDKDVQLLVQDDGSGFDAHAALASSRGGVGLKGMRERAEQLGGFFTVRSHLGEGTEIEVIIPTS